jgi:hypothetical protein
MFPDYPDEPTYEDIEARLTKPVEGKIVNRPKPPTSWSTATTVSAVVGSAFMLVFPTWLTVAWFIALTGLLCSR